MHQLEQTIRMIIKQEELHAKWLNTLSMLENAGARKIAASEHPRKVNLMILKHAAEEARHAYHLKSQIQKVHPTLCETYEPAHVLSPKTSYYYLAQLDLQVCRYLKRELQLQGDALKYAAYLLVTYAIEVRADELYPVYYKVLKETNSKVNIRFIIVEEEGHLEEMIQQLQDFSPQWEKHAKQACQYETHLFQHWLAAVSKEVTSEALDRKPQP